MTKIVFAARPPGLTLEKILDRMAATGRLTNLNVVRSEGRYQASLQRPGTSAYRVTVKPTASEAIIDVLKPEPSRSWEDWLGLDGEDDGLDLI